MARAQKTFADPLLGDLRAEPGSREWALGVRASLWGKDRDLGQGVAEVAMRLDRLLTTGGWKHLFKEDGTSPFSSIEEYIAHPKPYGLNVPLDMMRHYLGLTHEGKAIRAHLAVKAHPTRHLPLTSLRCDGDTQIRVETSAATVESYAAALSAGTAFPPVTVFFDGEAHWLADGFHRVAAYEKAGIAEVLAEVREGSRRDALLFAVGANGHHGLPRTNADKRRAVTVLLQDEEWGKCSDRWIAERALVHHQMVGRLRAEMAPPQVDDSSTSSPPEARTGKDGKSYPTKREPKPAPTPPAPLSPDPSLAASVRNAPDRAELEAAYTRTSGSVRTPEEAEAIGAAYRDRIAELSQAPAPPPAPPSSGQVALELDAPTTPEAPDAPEADDLVAQLHLLERELVGTTPAFRERARMAVAGLIADARRNRR